MVLSYGITVYLRISVYVRMQEKKKFVFLDIMPLFDADKNENYFIIELIFAIIYES